MFTCQDVCVTCMLLQTDTRVRISKIVCTVMNRKALNVGLNVEYRVPWLLI